MFVRCKTATLLVLLTLVAIFLVASSASAWEIYVSSYAQSTVHRYTPAGVDLGPFTTGSAASGGLDIEFGGPAHDLYIASMSNYVLRYNGATGRYTSGTSLNMATCAAIDGSGRLYVTHRYSGSDSGMVTRYSDPTNWNSSTFISAGDNGLLAPYDIEIGPDTRVYILAKDANNGNAQTVYVYNQSGTFICKKATGTSYAISLAFKPVDDGYLYFSDYSGNTVWRISYSGLPNGSFSSFCGGGSLSSAYGIEFGPDGNLYVASYGNNRIFKYNGSTGAYISDFSCVSYPRFVTFLPSKNIGVGPHTRALITKIYRNAGGGGGPAMGFTQDDAYQVDDAGFTLAIKDTDISDPINNTASLSGMEDYFDYCANAGIDGGTWQGGVAPYSYTSDGVYRLNRAGNSDTYYSGSYNYMRPKSVSGWTAMGDAIMEWVNLTSTYPNNKLLCLDFEGAGGLAEFAESYDDLTWSEYPNTQSGVSASQRYNNLVSRGLLQDYIDWQYNSTLTQVQNQRARIDEVNPNFQIGVYGWGTLIDAVRKGFATTTAPMVNLDTITYGRGPWNSAWDSDPLGGYGGSANRSDRDALRWSMDEDSQTARELLVSPYTYPTVYLAGHWAQVPGPSDGSHYKFLARQCFDSTFYGHAGYWIWTEADPYYTSWDRVAWIDATMDYFDLANAAIDAGNVKWSSSEVDAWYDMAASDPKTILSINGGTATKWNPITGVNEGTMSSSGYTAVTETAGDVDGISGTETVRLDDGWITIWNTSTTSELMRFPVGTDQTGFALDTLHSSQGRMNSWQSLVSVYSTGAHVRRYTQTGDDWDVFAKGPDVQYAMDIAISPSNGNLYVDDMTKNCVYRYDGAKGTYLSKLTTGSGGIALTNAVGLAFNSSGHLFVSHRDSGGTNGMVTKYTDPSNTSNPGASTFVSAGNNGLIEPYDIGIPTSNSNVYILGRDSGNGLDTIYCYNSSGTFQYKRTTGMSSTKGIAFNGSGANEYIYLSSYGDSNVKRVLISDLQSGTLTTFASGSGLSGAYGIGFSPSWSDNNLYVVSMASSPTKIMKFNGSTGAYISDVGTPSAPRYWCYSTGIGDTYEASNVATALTRPDGQMLAVKGTVTTLYGDGFWITSGGSGIKVLSTMTVSVNDNVTVQGVVTTVSGNKVIKATFVARPTVAT